MNTDSELSLRYADAPVGQSVRLLDLREKPPLEIHEELARLGFHSFRIPVPTSTSRSGERRFHRKDGGASVDANDPNVVFECVYSHADGGVVRLLPAGIPSFGLSLLRPSIRKSVLTTPPIDRDGAEYSLDAEAFVVTVDGDPIPKSVCTDHGLRVDVDVATWRNRAVDLLTASRSFLDRGPAPVLPLVVDRPGLVVSRTIVPDVGFDVVLRAIEMRVIAFGDLILRHEAFGRTHLLFPGQDKRAERLSGYGGLTSLSLNLGQYTLGLDPVGYGPSIAHLEEFIRPLLEGMSHAVYDDATGENLTSAIALHPSHLTATKHRFAHH